MEFIPGILDFYQNKDLKRSGQNYKYNIQSRPRCVYMDWGNTSYGSSQVYTPAKRKQPPTPLGIQSEVCQNILAD